MKFVFSEPEVPSTRKIIWIIFFTILVFSGVGLTVYSLVYLKYFLIDYLQFSYDSSEEKRLSAIIDSLLNVFTIFSPLIIIYLIIYLLKLFRLDQNRSQLVFNNNKLIYMISDGRKITKKIDVHKSSITVENENTFTLHEDNSSYYFKNEFEPASILTYLFVWKTLGFPIGSKYQPNILSFYMEFLNSGVNCICVNHRNNRKEKICLLEWI